MQTNANVVITGMGILSSIGEDLATFSTSLRDGKSGISRMAAIKKPNPSVDIAAELRDFSFQEKLNALQNLPDEIKQKAKRLGQRAPFTIQTSIISVMEAWRNAQMFMARPVADRVGVIVAGQNSTQNYQDRLITGFRENPEYLSPRYALEFLETNQVGVLSELFDIRGEGFVAGGASASGNLGIMKGFQAIRAGLLDVCVVIGVVADLSPMDIQGFVNIGAMGGKKFADQPEKACRPFDTGHEGFIYGQASACVILESESSAWQRGVPYLAEILGASMNLDGNSSSDPNVNGEVKAMLAALEQAKITPSDIDYINTHGSSSPLGDKTEAEALSRLLANQHSKVWVNATKGLTGHCLWSAGVVELIATVLQMRNGFLHPNRNLEEPVHSALRFCGAEAVDHRITFALSNSFGFGGINTSIVVKRAAE